VTLKSAAAAAAAAASSITGLRQRMISPRNMQQMVFPRHHVPPVKIIM
jgi:hypothetical protein